MRSRLPRGRFDEKRQLACGLAAVRVGQRWGYANCDGSVRIDVKYDWVSRFDERERAALVCLNGEEFYIDSDGDRVPASSASRQGLHRIRWKDIPVSSRHHLSDREYSKISPFSAPHGYRGHRGDWSPGGHNEVLRPPYDERPHTGK